MPLIDVTYLESVSLEDGYKPKLAEVFAAACHNVLGSHPKDVIVRLHPVSPEDYYVGGWNVGLLQEMNADTGQPVVTMRVELYPGRAQSAKDALAMLLAQQAANVLRVPVETVETDIVETNPRTNYVGGKPFKVATNSAV